MRLPIVLAFLAACAPAPDEAAALPSAVPDDAPVGADDGGAVAPDGLSATADAVTPGLPPHGLQVHLVRKWALDGYGTEPVALVDGGETVHFTMVGNTCSVNENVGMNRDQDLVPGDEDLEDADDQRVLVRGAGGLRVAATVDPHRPGVVGYGTARPVQTEGTPLAGGLWFGGVAALTDGDACRVEWPGRDVVREVDADLCRDPLAFDVDHRDGAVVVATGSGTVWRVTHDHAVEIGDGTDVAWEPTTRTALLLDPGHDRATAVDPTGGVRWASPPGAGVVSAAALPAWQAFAVLTEHGATHTIEVLDARTGTSLGRLFLPARELPYDLGASPDGAALLVKTFAGDVIYTVE